MKRIGRRIKLTREDFKRIIEGYGFVLEYEDEDIDTEIYTKGNVTINLSPQKGMVSIYLYIDPKTQIPGYTVCERYIASTESKLRYLITGSSRLPRHLLAKPT